MNETTAIVEYLSAHPDVALEVAELTQDEDVLAFCSKILRVREQAPNVLRFASLILRLREEIVQAAKAAEENRG